MSKTALPLILKELASAGATVDRIVQNSHTKIFFRHRGAQRSFVTSTSPSDRRNHLNSLAQLRRVIGRDHLTAKHNKGAAP